MERTFLGWSSASQSEEKRRKYRPPSAVIARTASAVVGKAILGC